MNDVVNRRTTGVYIRLYDVIIHVYVVHIRIHTYLNVRSQLQICSSTYD